MTSLPVDSDKQFCLYCRKPLQGNDSDSTNLTNSDYHVECQELMYTFNTDEFSPYSLYEDFILVKKFFEELISDTPNNGGLNFINFLRDSCYWNNDGKLIKLKIFGGFINKIPALISSFSNLSTLIVHNNRNLSLPDELADLEKLDHLEVHLNSYYRQNYPIPEIILQNHLLRRLFLTGYFSSIDIPFDSFPLLEELRLIIFRDEKKYLDFPTAIDSCFNLQNLQVNAKYLNFRENKFSELKYLEEFDLSSNNLDKLPNSFSELHSLRKLLLVSNRFKQIPEILISLPKLEELDLSMNMIQRIGEYATKFVNLQQLHLTDNPLKENKFDDLLFKVYY